MLNDTRLESEQAPSTMDHFTDVQAQDTDATVTVTERDTREINKSIPLDTPSDNTPYISDSVSKPCITSDESPIPVIIPSKAPYHERYYLRYHEGKRTTSMDLEGTKDFLQHLGYDGGELRMAREGKDFAKNLQNTLGYKNTQVRCSYCGADITGVEFSRLPDNRVRCTSCSRTVVKNKAEVEELCKRVIANMSKFFGANIDVNVSIELMEERKLKKKLGIPLGIQDNLSILVLGVAINKKNNYTILLENGAPRISLIATFAHELTHIWQYLHWDSMKGFKQCPQSKRLLVYEGMAKWAEIQYLYLMGETAVAKREEYIIRNRDDEYGKGFCLYDDWYPLSREAMTCEETPFKPERYPFD